MKTKTLYKFLRTGLNSHHGNCSWKLGEWKTTNEKVSLCVRGFHASGTPLQALGYVKGEIVAQVEVRGKHEADKDKEVWSEMRIVKAWNWTKEDSVSLAIFAAEQVIGIFEKKYPNDNRPRKAIEAARKYLRVLKDGNAYAADAAYAAADAAYAAADAAYAAYAAAAAAYAAAYAADAAAYAAYAAAYAADADAYAADADANARKKLVAKIDAWFLNRLTTLTEIK